MPAHSNSYRDEARTRGSHLLGAHFGHQTCQQCRGLRPFLVILDCFWSFSMCRSLTPASEKVDASKWLVLAILGSAEAVPKENIKLDMPDPILRVPELENGH